MSTSTDTAEVVVVGGGLEGCATAWALAERGVTDVVIVERSTVGRRRHRQVVAASCAATTASRPWPPWRPRRWTSSRTPRRSSARTSASTRPATSSASARRTSRPCTRRWRTSAPSASGPRTSTAPRSSACGRWPTSSPSPPSRWEERGGYGDAYQTAQAFAGAARRAGVRLRQGTTVTGILSAGDEVTGVALADGSRIHSRRVVLAAGPWSVPLLAAHGVDLPITVHREQIVLIDPGPGPRAGAGVLRPGLAAVRPERDERSDGESGQRRRRDPLRQLRPRRARAGRPRPVLQPGQLRLPRPRGREGRDAVPRAGERVDRLDVRRLLRRHPRLQPRDLRDARRRPVRRRRVLRARVQDRPVGGRLVADLVVDGKSRDVDIPESDFRLSRFAEGDLLRSPHPYVGAGQMR